MTRRNPTPVDREDLKRLYLIEKQEVQYIADYFGVTKKIIYARIKEYGIPYRGYNRHLDIAGQKFGKLLVIKKSFIRDATWHWECLCDCGNNTYVRGSCLVSGQIQGCGCGIRQGGSNNRQWKGVGELSGEMWCRYRLNAKKRNLDFTISKEYAWDIFQRQEARCALTDVPLRFDIRTKDVLATASLDRIDSKKGYIEGNVRWVHKQVNRLKWDLSDEEFLEWCHKTLMVQHESSQKNIEYYI